MRTKPNIVVLSLSSDLDVTTVPAVRREVESLLKQGCLRIILNMADVSYVDSAGMSFIMCALRRIRSMGGLMSLTNVSQPVFRGLSRMRLVDFMPVARVGAREHIAPLDPRVHPLWQTTFRVDPTALCTARTRLDELLASVPFSNDARFDLKLAVGEAIGNAADHTCEGGILTTVAASADRVIIDVADCGAGYTLADDEEPPEVSCCSERGRGVKLMRLLTDAVSISVKPSGKGTVVHLVKLVR